MVSRIYTATVGKKSESAFERKRTGELLPPEQSEAKVE
jgi:hypothetical protein